MLRGVQSHWSAAVRLVGGAKVAGVGTALSLPNTVWIWDIALATWPRIP